MVLCTDIECSRYKIDTWDVTIGRYNKDLRNGKVMSE